MSVFSSTIADESQELLPTGITPFHITVTVPTDALDSADEQVLLYQVPESSFEGEVWLQQVVMNVDDLDGGAGLVFDVGLGDSDGVLDTTLVTGSTTGQAGGVEVVLDFADLPVEAAGKYLIVDVTTAAVTPQAGDIEVFGEFAAGVLSRSDTAVAV